MSRRSIPAQPALRNHQRLDAAIRLVLEPLEGRLLLSGADPLQSNEVTAIKSGLKGLADWADTLDAFGDIGRQLPLVGRSIGQALDVGTTLRNALSDAVDGLVGMVPNPSPAQIETAIETATGGTVTCLLDDPGKIRFQVNFQKQRAENRPLDLGTNSDLVNIDAAFNAQFTTTLQANFEFGFDRTAGLADDEAFFVVAPAGAFVASASVGITNANFGLTIGLLGPDADGTIDAGVRATGGNLNLSGEVRAGLNDQNSDGRVSLDEIQSTTLDSLVAVTLGPAGDDLTGNVSVEAKLGTFTGTGTVSVTDANLFDATPPAVSLTSTTLDQFKNLSAEGLVALLRNLGTSIQSVAKGLNPDGGVPFVGEAVSQAVNFAELLDDLTAPLFDARLTGATSHTSQAEAQANITAPATLTVSLDNGAPVSVTSVTGGFAAVVADLDTKLAAAGVSATVEGTRVKLAADDPNRTLTVQWHADDAGMEQLGFVDTVSNAVFRFTSIQSAATILARKMGIDVTGKTPAEILAALGINYDLPADALLLNVKFNENFTKPVELDFTDSIPVGPATLAVSGSLDASVTANAKVDLQLGLNLANLTNFDAGDDPFSNAGADDLFVKGGGKVTGSATFTGAGDLHAALGILEVGVNGAAVNFTAGGEFTLGGDGKISPGEFLDPGVITLPTFNASGTVKLPLVLEGTEDLGIALPGADPNVTLAFAAAPATGVTFTATATGLEDLFKQLTNFSTDNIFSVLQQVVGLVQNSELSLFNEPLPLVNKSLKEMLDFATKLSDGLAAVTGGVTNLKERLLGDVTGGGGPAGLLQGLKDALANTPLLNQLNTLGEQGQLAARELLHTVDALQDALHTLPEQNDVTFKVPANLVSALSAVQDALHRAGEHANALPDDTVKTDILNGLEQFEDALGPISKALPAVQRLVDFLFDALDLRSLITAAGFAAITTQITGIINQSLGKLDEAIAPLADSDPKKAALQEAKAALTAARDQFSGALSGAAGIADLDLPALLKSFNKLGAVLDQFDDAGEAFADDPNVADEAGDFLRQARNLFSASFPGRPSINFANGELDIGFDFDLSKTVIVPLDFDLNDTALGVLPLEVTSQGEVEITVGAGLSLDLGLDLDQLATAPLSPANILDSIFFRDTTAFQLTGFVDGEGIGATVSIGAIEAITLGPGAVFLKEVADAGNTAPARLSLDLEDNSDGTNDGKVSLADFTLSNFDPDGTGQFKLSMPVTIAGETLAQPIVIELGDITDFGSLTFSLPPDLVEKLQENLLSIEFLIDGLIQLLDRLSNGLVSDILNKLPVVGDAIDFAGSALGDLLAAPADGAALAPASTGGFIDGLKAALENFTDTGRQAVEDKLKEVFFNLLGAPGLGLLILDPKKHDSDGDPNNAPDTVADFRDVDIAVSADLDAPEDAKIVAKLPLGKRDDESTPDVFEGDVVHAPFDLGFNGLGLVGFQTTGAVELKLEYSIDLAFEISKAGGFSFLLDTGPVAPGDLADTKELELELDAGFTDGTKVNANLFFLTLEGVNADSNGDGKFTSISGDASVDLVGSGGKVSITDLGSLEFKPEVNASAQVDLGLTTGITTGAIEPNQNLPSIKADLLVLWTFNLTAGSGVSTESPEVQLNDIRLDLGGFISKVLGPIIDTIDDFLSPIQPLLDLLDTEIPVISQVAQLVGQPPVRFIDAIGALGQGAETVQRVLDILLAVNDIVTLAKSFADDGSVVIPFGDLKFGDDKPIEDQLAGSLRDRFTNEFDAAYGNLTGAAKDFIEGLRGGEAGAAAAAAGTDIGEFNIPLFDDPFQIINLMFGKDVDLVTWDIPRMEASFEFSQLFGPIIPPFPVFAKIGGGFGIFADLYMGLDTRGLRTGDFLNSIFFGDRDPTTPQGKEVPELGVFLEFKAGAELSIPFAKAGVEGGIRADINADWNDPDENGKVHLDELLANFQRGLECVFDLTGQFDAFISAYLNIEIPLAFTSITIIDVSFDIFRATLFDFTITCPPLPPPVPATLEGGVLKLNIGDRAGFRQPGATDVDEMVEVFAEGERDGKPGLSATADRNNDGKMTADELGEDFDGDGIADPNVIAVVGFGVLQIFDGGVNSILGNAGEGDDTVIIDATVTKPATVTGGNGDDQIRGGSGGDNLSGGEGADEITGGKGGDTVGGGNGNDKLAGNAGGDTVDGGEGDDAVYGGSNDGNEGSKTPDASDDDLGDSVLGGGGNDQVYGHLGNDTMSGGSGADNLTGGDGADQMSGGADNDLMFGDAGGDAMSGGTGDDQMKGGEDADNMSGNAGNDYMEGGKSGGADGSVPDTVDGGSGNDSVIGGSATDDPNIVGPNRDIDGDDNLIGGTENDTILGDNGIIGSVTLFGGLGNDTISGGSGTDLIYGQGGDDDIAAGADNDTVFAGASADSVHGDGENDLILGESGDDTVFGDAGSDTVEAGTGDDDVYGNTGNDLLKGQEGHDSIEGNAGQDTILGGVGNDSIIGGSSDEAQINAGGEVGDSIVGSAGDDIILGDNGRIVGLTAFTDPRGGAGIDTVFGGANHDTIFGGGSGDILNGDSAVDSGNDIVVGDQGTKTATQITADHSTVAGSGGDDSIFGSAGNDTLLGGDGNDTVSGDAGSDVAVGDNGTVTVSGATVLRTETDEEAFGGDDQITGGTESDVLLGGTGDDLLAGGDGAAQDIILGDNGVVVGPGGAADANDVFTTDPTLGGIDTITGGAGDDILLGGSGANPGNAAGGVDLAPANAPTPDPLTPSGDSIDGGDGNDIALGDNGEVIRDGSLAVQRIATTDPTRGGHDTIDGGAGGDTMLGGFGRDRMLGQGEDDVLLGDNGLVRLVAGPDPAAEPRVITTTFPNDGDSDTITAGDGNDTVMGGANSESILGGNGNDLIFGDHGQVLLDQPSNSNFFSIDTGDADGGAPDTIEGEAGDDTALGGQGGDVILGGTEDDDLTGGHNVASGADANDTMDGGAGDDVLAGDNARIIRQVGPNYSSPLARTLLNGGTMYDPATGLPNVDASAAAARRNPNGAVGRDVTLFDHADNTAAGLFGNDTMAGGADDDTMFGQLGDDRMQGDASVAVNVSMAGKFTVGTPSAGNALTDGDDYVEGNGGQDLIFGNLGQDDLIGGSSSLFGLDTAARRPDLSDTIFGGAGTDLARDTNGDLTDCGHATDADMIVGDNGNVFRLVSEAGPGVTAFLTFNYDNYTPTDPDPDPALYSRTRIIPRALQLLDYSADGNATNDTGGADVVHGEAGDDSAHGASGDDYLFGEGQDDDLFGESGDDWISGGTGEDGVLGDDGKILTSRNGLAEPLYGLAAQAQRTITTPGNAHVATLFVTGRLNKTADLEPFSVGGRDTVYGGRGDDWLHAGAGDDAVSGAEALGNGALNYYANPDDTPLVTFNTTTGEWDGFSDVTPLAKITGHALNFEATDSLGNKINDGNDVIFGDEGNDWLVGGTNADHIYGGRGHDLMNADDNLETAGGANNVPDPDPFADGDTVYGGGGRDTLLGNTGADRLIDWVGEFNAYVVPFAPFGDRTVTRQIPPGLVQFLYDLSFADGADRTRSGPGLGASPRNGEPFGELGLFLQQDPEWQEQTGGPADPQAGNKPGGPKDKR